MNERDSTIMQLIFGEDEDTATAVVQCPLDVVPRVGETVGSITHRDEKGNYINDGKEAWDRDEFRDLGTGVVTKVEHMIEERGKNPRQHHWRHFINVYIKAQP